MPHSISVPAWQAVTSLFHSVAFFCTIFRLYRRYIMKHIWWDDFCAFIAFVLDVIYASTIGMRDEMRGDNPNMTPKRRQLKIVVFWLTATLPPWIVWISRISICLLIARMDVQHTNLRIRPWNYLLMTSFALVGGAMFCQKIWVCVQSNKWHYSPSVQCQVGKTAGYISLTGDLLADAILTAVSLRLLWKVHMRRSQRRLLAWLFGANIWSSLAGVLYGVVVIKADELGSLRALLIGLAVHIKTSTTLTVCNLVVVVTYLYARFWKNSEDIDSDSGATPVTRRHSNLPDGRTTKQPTGPQSDTILILTEFNSDGSTVSRDHRLRRDITTTLMTCASSDIRWAPRVPPNAVGLGNRFFHHTSLSVPSLPDDAQHFTSLSRSISEPSSSLTTRTIVNGNTK